jgi:DNA-binding NarL/FixJ family response regulator
LSLPCSGDTERKYKEYTLLVIGLVSQPARSAIVVEDISETRAWLIDVLHCAFGDIAVDSAVDLKSARQWFAVHETKDAHLLALVDIGLPDGSGIDLIRELKLQHPDVEIVVTTVYDDEAHLIDAMAAGAHGYLLKDRDKEELITQLRGLDHGEAPLSPAMARRILDQFRLYAGFKQASVTNETPLTERETEVLRLIGRGLTLKEAAGVFDLSSQTVASHVKNIYRKLGIASRAEAAIEATRRNLT